MATELTGQTLTVSVGEKINLAVKYKTNWGRFKSVQWTVPGTIVRNYKDRQQNAVLTRPVDLTQREIIFYWVDGQDGRVVKADCVYTSKGKDTNKTVSATFDVKRPKLDTFTSTTDIPRLMPPPPAAPTYLRFGQAAHTRDPATPGILWNWKISANGAHSGRIKDIQLILVDLRYTLPGPPATKYVWTRPGMHTPPGIWLLDSENPYGSVGAWGRRNGGPWALGSSGSVSSNDHISDSPAIGLTGCSRVFYKASFLYYLLYRSFKQSSIWIPIGVLPWSWQGEATLSGGVWSLGPAASLPAAGANPSGSDTLDFPVWAYRVPNDLHDEVE